MSVKLGILLYLLALLSIITFVKGASKYQDNEPEQLELFDKEIYNA